MSITPNDAWQELLILVERGASEVAARATPQLRWLRPNRLVLLDRWQVQARFVAEPGKYSIYLERFGAELGDVNFESTPNSGEPKRTVLTLPCPQVYAVRAGIQPLWKIKRHHYP